MEDQALGLQRSAYVQWTDLDLTDGEPFSAAVLDRSRELEASVEQWIRLVRRSGRECSPTHLDDVLEHLGKMPPEERPNARALWVAGLLNPLPSFSTSVPGKFAAMGPTVAPEIRAATLSAAGAEARLGTIRTALSESMRRLAKMVGDD